MTSSPQPFASRDERHDAITRMEVLRRELRRHNFLYYVVAEPEISDREYDRMLAELQDLEARLPEYRTPDSPSQSVGGATLESFVTVEHRLPMLSIDNSYEESSLREFDRRVREGLGTAAAVEYVVEYKIDGVALAVIYERGELVQAITRGDGARGDDVTANARTINGIPLVLNAHGTPGGELPAIIEIRGEAFIRNTDFAHLLAAQQRENEQQRKNKPQAKDKPLFKNSRNTTAGAIKLLDPQLCALRRLSFAAHSAGYLEGSSYPSHQALMQAVETFGVATSPGRRVAVGIEAAIDCCGQLMDELHAQDFEVDGCVIKVNDLAVREQLGSTSRSPRWVIAYKVEKYEGTTRVEEITVQVGKTGTLTPVANLSPVKIAGTTVSRASLHNRDEIERLGVRIGDTVIVEKAGKIIPHVVRVEEHLRDGTEQPFHFPENCPECGTAAVKDDGGVYIRCPNLNCPAQLRETLRFFASRAAMDIEGLGTALIDALTAGGPSGKPFVTSLADIYRLERHRDELPELELSGADTNGDANPAMDSSDSDENLFAERTSSEKKPRQGPRPTKLKEKRTEKLLAGIAASKDRPLWRLLTGLNIRHVGKRTAQLLADRFGTVDEIIRQSAAELSEVDEVGPVIAESVHRFFASEHGRRLIEELRELGVSLGTARPQVADGAATGGESAGVATGLASAADAGSPSRAVFAGLSIVVTGTLQRFDRREIEEMIAKYGGKPTSSVSKSTAFVVAGEKAGSKLTKAQQLGIPVISEDDFLQRLSAPATVSESAAMTDGRVESTAMEDSTNSA